MTYLSINRFWDYQNADVWKKAKGHPPWYKHFVHRDRELYALEPMARLLFYELLGAATRHKNVLFSDPKWLLTETLIDEQEIAKHLPTLLKGGWIKESSRPKRSRKPSRKVLEKPLDLKEEEEDKDIPLTPPKVGNEISEPTRLNPRANGTNPRAIAQSEKRLRSLREFIVRFQCEYTFAQLLDELEQRGCSREEALWLVNRK